jgi:hypothetical protein
MRLESAGMRRAEIAERLGMNAPSPVNGATESDPIEQRVE